MISGTVKYYNSERRFGLIKRADGERDVRFLFDALKKSGIKDIKAGQKLRFELSTDPHTGKVTACDLRSF